MRFGERGLLRRVECVKFIEIESQQWILRVFLCFSTPVLEVAGRFMLRPYLSQLY